MPKINVKFVVASLIATAVSLVIINQFPQVKQMIERKYI